MHDICTCSYETMLELILWMLQKLINAFQKRVLGCFLFFPIFMPSSMSTYPGDYFARFLASVFLFLFTHSIMVLYYYSECFQHWWKVFYAGFIDWNSYLASSESMCTCLAVHLLASSPILYRFFTVILFDSWHVGIFSISSVSMIIVEWVSKLFFIAEICLR